eukprot:2016096-Amphidinium_carterae.1
MPGECTRVLVLRFRGTFCGEFPLVSNTLFDYSESQIFLQEAKFLATDLPQKKKTTINSTS